MEQQMTTADALALLDKATSSLKLDRVEHGMIIAALQTFQKLDLDHQKLVADYQKATAVSNKETSEKVVLGESLEALQK